MNSKTKWNLMYVESKKYYATYGNLLVPYNYKTSYDIRLGRWICEIRKLRKLGKLDSEKIKLLDELDMVWDVSLYKWNIMYDLAKEYYDIRGDLLIEESFISDNGLELGRWIVNQRQIYFGKIPGLLTNMQVEKLEDIGMVWDDVRKNRWLKKYEIAKKFYEEQGFLPLANKYKDIYPEIYSWLRVQRNLYKRNKLSTDKIEALKRIGFIVEKSNSKYSKMDNLVSLLIKDNVYINIDLNKDILERMSIEELEAKIEFLQANNILPVDNKGRLIDIFTMSSEDIKNDSRYGKTLEEMMTKKYRHDIIKIRRVGKNDKA